MKRAVMLSKPNVHCINTMLNRSSTCASLTKRSSLINCVNLMKKQKDQCNFHTINSQQRIKFEQALSEVSNINFANIQAFLEQQQHDNSLMEILKKMDFRKLATSGDSAIVPRSTFHEYNGNLMRLSRKPDESVRSSAVMALFVERWSEKEGRRIPYLVLLQKTPAKKNTNYQHAGMLILCEFVMN